METNSFDWNTFSCIFAIVIGIIAFVSPIITAIINNDHQTKIKKLDMYEAAKRNALSDFITAAQASLFAPDGTETMLEYTASFDRLFIYFSDISLDTIRPFDIARTEVNNNNTSENFKKANTELSKIVIELSKQISKE